MLQAACGPARLCGTAARRHHAQGAQHTPAQAAHPLAAGVPEGGARPAAASPASRAASPARGCCIPAPPLPVVTQMVLNLAKIVHISLFVLLTTNGTHVLVYLPEKWVAATGPAEESQEME